MDQHDDQTALAAIEKLAAVDLGMRAGAGLLKIGEMTEAQRRLAAIYRIAHSHVRTHSCYPYHLTWRAEAAKEAKP